MIQDMKTIEMPSSSGKIRLLHAIQLWRVFGLKNSSRTRVQRTFCSSSLRTGAQASCLMWSHSVVTLGLSEWQLCLQVEGSRPVWGWDLLRLAGRPSSHLGKLTKHATWSPSLTPPLIWSLQTSKSSLH